MKTHTTHILGSLKITYILVQTCRTERVNISEKIVRVDGRGENARPRWES